MATSIGDKVWNDTNRNGVQDAGEAGKAGVTVQLYTCVNNAPGTLVATRTTDANGNYSFAGLKPGDYMLKFIANDGSLLSTANVGSSDLVDSDAGTNGFTGCYTLASGTANTSADAGFYQLAAIGDRVWNDTNANGIQDAGETGKAGVLVNLFVCSGGVPTAAVGSTVTDANGNYRFVNLPAGQYIVQFTSTDGTVLSTANIGDDAFDSDVLAGGFSLGDKVWLDTNRNGIQDAGEAGKANVVLQLYKVGADGVAGTADDVYVAQQTTDANGNYKFTGLVPDTYTVKVVGTGLNAASEEITIANAGSNDASDSDASTLAANRISGFTDAVTLRSGQDNTTVDIGVTGRLGSIGDTVWMDTNRDGVQNDGNTGVGGVTVQLKSAGADGIFGTADDVVLQTKTTDISGKYLFTGLTAGNYQVQFGQAAGTEFTLANVGADTTDNDANRFNGTTDTITLAAGQDRTDVDAGLRAAKAFLGDRVWYDTNGNGVQDAGEAGVAGMTVQLIDPTKAPNVGPGGGKQVQVIATTTTDANGNYGFFDLDAGLYQVRFVNKEGYEWTSRDSGGNDAADSDANIYTGMTDVISLATGQQNKTIDAGIVVATHGKVGDFVWWDANHNGIQDGGYYEPGFTNIKVSLQDSQGNTIATTRTDTSGKYLFTNLDEGDYRVVFENEGAGQWARADVGNNDLIDADAYSTTKIAYTPYFHLNQGQTDLTWDAGITPIVLDLDANGIQTVSRFDSTGSFDLFGDGTAVESGWISSGDAFLAVDSNHNGSIDSVSELFGGTSKGAGFAKLASFDSNGDGLVDAKDAAFKDLTVWRDANGNHATDAGELMTLAQAGVDSLKVAHTDVPEVDAQGNLHLERSSATLAGGQEVAMTDVYFAVSGEDAKAAGVSGPSMAELLGHESLDGVLGSVAPATTVAANDVEPAVDVSEAAELLRKLSAAMHQGNESHAMAA
ncbi:SdrD B-like domain-containing protein [Variovorax sp. J22R133]|uniref:SdrD B-like domain-containing protein n=1 Tax=Variovorax brevis TaxID=3053503 RepID=UPI0025750FBB|nr:SdrD B-like domain-containing protein [Variovorax sp. J22R133]MDM0111536.1 SdrD B-like domain-containing protein [Variovorax sp. J22R133]